MKEITNSDIKSQTLKNQLTAYFYIESKNQVIFLIFLSITPYTRHQLPNGQ